jgi:hypothetical protein
VHAALPNTSNSLMKQALSRISWPQCLATAGMVRQLTERRNANVVLRNKNKMAWLAVDDDGWTPAARTFCAQPRLLPYPSHTSSAGVPQSATRCTPQRQAFEPRLASAQQRGAAAAGASWATATRGRLQATELAGGCRLALHPPAGRMGGKMRPREPQWVASRRAVQRCSPGPPARRGPKTGWAHATKSGGAACAELWLVPQPRPAAARG